MITLAAPIAPDHHQLIVVEFERIDNNFEWMNRREEWGGVDKGSN